MNNTVIVKSLNKPNWAGMHRYNKCHDTIVAIVNRNGFNTGLSKTQQAELEKELGYEEGQLAPHSPFWKEYGVTITDKPLYLNLDNPQDQLDYSIIKASPRVSNSANEMSKWPKAEYVIHNKEEDAQLENETIDVEARAIHDFMELSPSGHRDYLKLLGNNAASMSPAVVRNTLFKIAKNNPAEFNRISDMPDRKNRLLIYNLLSASIIRVKGGHYYYQDIPLGHGEEACARYLEEAENQELKIALLGKLKETEKA